MADDAFGARGRMTLPSGTVTIHRLEALERRGLCRLDRLPYSIRILLEQAVRAAAAGHGEESARRIAAWRPEAPPVEIEFRPARILAQDLTGVPLVVDLAGMRAAVADAGGDPLWVEPQIPVDLVIDHSVQVDAFGTPAAFEHNVEREYERNGERYQLLRWAQGALRGFRVVPPGTGIVHQVNLEYLAQVVTVRRGAGGEAEAFPDTLVGTDSHTTMIGGVGVLGWGVGGIEAEAAMLGEPYGMALPAVVGVRLEGQLPPGTTATDLVLALTELLRRHGVVDRFVEFCGPGCDALPVPDRATIANMAPEYGATIGFFPVDGRTLDYLRATGRSAEQVETVERYCREQGLFRTPEAPEPEWSSRLTLDLSTVRPALAGPRRPEDRVALADVPRTFRAAFPPPEPAAGGLPHGAVAIAAITSCTNTSNPSVMVAAGLLARAAVRAGLRVPAHVKTSLAPGSRVVTDYLERAGLLSPLQELGFSVVGYGCTTCIGNSGELVPEAAAAARAGTVLAAVLSGNRNFQGRIHPLVRANYLASPPLVVAYALAGRIDVDLETEPLGAGADGRPVFLRDLWPEADQVAGTVRGTVDPAMFRRRYEAVFDGDARWRALPVPEGATFAWDPASTYVRRPPFFAPPPGAGQPIRGARVLALLPDSVTTDDISPAGAIAPDSDAAAYLQAHGVERAAWNQYGARRGNHELMVRGTFGNVRLRNGLVPGREGPWTRLLPDGVEMTIFQAAQTYASRGVPLLVLGGLDYGKGSSRDWAAKGTMLLGVRAVLARSFERIHRGNLIGMGVLPLEFPDGRSAADLGLDGTEEYELGWEGELGVGTAVAVEARAGDGRTVRFQARARLETPTEVAYLREGGILPRTLRHVLRRGARTA
jgi:aconitate hydratase